jgi:hypothetical protein
MRRHSFYHKDGHTYRTNKASELCSQKEFTMKCEGDEHYYDFTPINFEDESLYDFITQSLECNAQLCNRVYHEGDYRVEEKVVLVIKDDIIELVKTLDYFLGVRAGWLAKLREQAFEFKELMEKMGAN